MTGGERKERSGERAQRTRRASERAKRKKQIVVRACGGCVRLKGRSERGEGERLDLALG
jgi:hypothetical protein